MVSIPGDSAESFGLACRQGATQGMTAAHRHDDLEFNHSDVDLDYLIDGRPHRIPAGTVAVFWAARPHQLLGGRDPGVETWLTVPLASALSWRLPAAFMRRMLSGEVAGTAASPGIRLDERVRTWARELDGDGTDRRIAATEIEAFALRMAGRVSRLAATDDPGEPGGSRRAAAAAMAAFLSEHSADDLSVADVAAHVRLNPRYAMSVFRQATGITIGDYLVQCRVAAAQHLLLTTDRSIADVGFSAGFRSQSQFYERFVRWCGRSPGAYRRALRGA